MINSVIGQCKGKMIKNKFVFGYNLQQCFLEKVVFKSMQFDIKKIKQTIKCIKDNPSTCISVESQLFNQALDLINNSNLKNDNLVGLLLEKKIRGKNTNEKVLKEIFDFIVPGQKPIGVIVYVNIDNNCVPRTTGKAIREYMSENLLLNKEDSPIIFNYLSEEETKQGRAEIFILTLIKSIF